jgi:hypothetical protein
LIGGDVQELLVAMAKEWRRRAEKMIYEHCHRSGKYYSSMSQEEQRAFNKARDIADGMTTCADELERFLGLHL